jgi:hypothetical protein
MRSTLLTLGLAAALLTACTEDSRTATNSATPSVTPSAGPTASPAYAVTFRPQDFTSQVTNPWFPLPVGRTLVYEGTSDGEPVRDVMVVSDETELVDGVACRVVLDRFYVDGKLAETTRDYFAQHTNGDVWYFGEDTAELESDGTMLSTDGTWRAGVAGALPGIVMTASPTVGDTHRQEYYRGYAEDFFRVDALGLRVPTPYRSFTGVLRTREWTPLEPGVLDRKFYARGVGLVKEQHVTGGDEQLALVEVDDG